METNIRQIRAMIEGVEKRCTDRANQIIQGHNQLVKIVADVARRQGINGPTTLDNQKAVHAAINESVRNYTNLIMLTGYAGIFGLWQMTRSLLTPHEDAIVGISLAISIFLFAGFEVYKMILGELYSKQLDDLLAKQPPLDDAERVRVWGLISQEHGRIVTRPWIWMLIPTVATGFGSGLYLLIKLIESLWR